MELPLISASGDAAEPAQAGPRGAGASTTHPEEGALGGGGSWQPTRLGVGMSGAAPAAYVERLVLAANHTPQPLPLPPPAGALPQLPEGTEGSSAIIGTAAAALVLCALWLTRRDQQAQRRRRPPPREQQQQPEQQAERASKARQALCRRLDSRELSMLSPFASAAASGAAFDDAGGAAMDGSSLALQTAPTVLSSGASAGDQHSRPASQLLHAVVPLLGSKQACGASCEVPAPRPPPHPATTADTQAGAKAFAAAATQPPSPPELDGILRQAGSSTAWPPLAPRRRTATTVCSLSLSDSSTSITAPIPIPRPARQQPEAFQRGTASAPLSRRSSTLTSSAGFGSTWHSGSGGPLAELVQHVERQEAATGPQHPACLDRPSSHRLDCPAALPPHLREWLVDADAVSYLQHPSGALQELGSGSSARVFKALFNGEVVAAKEIDIGAGAEMQQAFLTEAERLQALRHPNIVGLMGLALTESKGVVLLELCEGRDLHSALDVKAAGSDQRLFSFGKKGRRVAFEVAKVLNYLHSRGVMQMDLKSENILLTASGTAKLADVGFSRNRAVAADDTPLRGTFSWLAPELLLGGACTPAVDVWAFGVLCWQLVTGEHPQRGAMRAPRVPEECPQSVADLILECMSDDPCDRPIAKDLLQRLGRPLHSSVSLQALSRLSLDKQRSV